MISVPINMIRSKEGNWRISNPFARRVHHCQKPAATASSSASPTGITSTREEVVPATAERSAQEIAPAPPTARAT